MKTIDIKAKHSGDVIRRAEIEDGWVHLDENNDVEIGDKIFELEAQPGWRHWRDATHEDHGFHVSEFYVVIRLNYP